MLTREQRRRFERQARNMRNKHDSTCECKRCTEDQAAIIAGLGGRNQTLHKPGFPSRTS